MPAPDSGVARTARGRGAAVGVGGGGEEEEEEEGTLGKRTRPCRYGGALLLVNGS